MYNRKFNKYVPEPSRVTSDFYIACHYYPGWEMHGDRATDEMANLLKYPDRIPVQGLYDCADSEIMDWEIKWACEHGINCFIFCWYRYKENMGKPVTKSDLRLADTIHNALFNAKYKDFMDFAIMWECQKKWGAAEDKDDLCDNLLPFWVENYFSKPNYMKINNKPVVYIYAAGEVIKQFGSNEKCAEAFSACNEKIKEYGFDGIIFASEQYRRDLSEMDTFFDAGFDYAFQYGWYPEQFDLTDDEFEDYKKTVKLESEYVINYQLDRIEERIKNYPGKVMFSASVSRDATPTWLDVFGLTKLTNSECQWRLLPEEYKELLKKIRARLSKLDKDDIARKVIVIDNWNEWGEGHYVSPCTGWGFKYLQAIREALTNCDNLADYRTPAMLDFKLYDEGFEIK